MEAPDWLSLIGDSRRSAAAFVPRRRNGRNEILLSVIFLGRAFQVPVELAPKLYLGEAAIARNTVTYLGI
jgi:hypothetical protein